MGSALLGGGVEELLHESQLAVAADERRLEAGRLERTAPPRRYAQSLEELGLLLLSLQLVCARVLVDDCELARTAGCVADEHRAGQGNGLHTGSGVDEV